MVRERIIEVVDFARSESPYRNANKGWITNDLFLQWGKASNRQPNSGDEVLDLFVYWGPVQKLLSILFLVISLAAAFVFLSIGFSKGRIAFTFNSSTFDTPKQEVVELVQPLNNKIDYLEKNIEIDQDLTGAKINTANKTELQRTIEQEEKAPQSSFKKNSGTAGNLF